MRMFLNTWTQWTQYGTQFESKLCPLINEDNQSLIIDWTQLTHFFYYLRTRARTYGTYLETMSTMSEEQKQLNKTITYPGHSLKKTMSHTVSTVSRAFNDERSTQATQSQGHAERAILPLFHCMRVCQATSRRHADTDHGYANRMAMDTRNERRLRIPDSAGCRLGSSACRLTRTIKRYSRNRNHSGCKARGFSLVIVGIILISVLLVGGLDG